MPAPQSMRLADSEYVSKALGEVVEVLAAFLPDRGNPPRCPLAKRLAAATRTICHTEFRS